MKERREWGMDTKKEREKKSTGWEWEQKVERKSGKERGNYNGKWPKNWIKFYYYLPLVFYWNFYLSLLSYYLSSE